VSIADCIPVVPIFQAAPQAAPNQMPPSQPSGARIPRTTQIVVEALAKPTLPYELDLLTELALELAYAHEMLDNLGIPREDGDYGPCSLAERIAWVTDLRPAPSLATDLIADGA
jgi:hypothetical protein